MPSVGHVAMPLGVVGRRRLARRGVEGIAGIDHAALDPHGHRIAQQQRRRVQRVRMVLDEVGVAEDDDELRLADLARGDGVPHGLVRGVVAPQRPPVERHPVGRAGAVNPVGLFQ